MLICEATVIEFNYGGVIFHNFTEKLNRKHDGKLNTAQNSFKQAVFRFVFPD